MAAPLSMLLFSGGITLALVVIFRYEHAHGVCFLRDARMKFDRTLEDTKLHLEHQYRQVTTQTIRQSIHYVFHQILTLLLRTIHRLEDTVLFIVRFNKNRANGREGVLPPSHFSAITDHQRETQLSDTEMQHKRDEALMGR